MKKLYRITVRWSALDGNKIVTFERVHERLATTRANAVTAEHRHNKVRLTDSEFKSEGWSYKIISVTLIKNNTKRVVSI